MSIARKVAYNTIVQVVGRATSIVLSLILVRYLTSYLGVVGFGEYTTAISFVSIFAIIADFGLSTIVVRELAKRENDLKGYLGNVLGLRMVVALVTIMAAPLIALLFPYSASLKLAILIVALANYLLSLNQVFVGVFQVNMRIDKAVLGDVAGRLVSFILTLLMIYYNYSLAYIVGAIVASNLINLFISWVLVRGYIHPSLKFDLKMWKKLFLEMLPMGIVVVLGMIYFRNDMIILSVIKGSHAVGIYGVSYKFVDILITLPQFFMGAVFPFVARYYLRDDQRFKEILQRATEVLVMAAFPIAAIFYFLAPHFIGFVSDSGFGAAVLPLQILIFGVMFSYLTQLPNSVLVATKNQGVLIWLYLILIVENIVLNIIFIPHYSFMAAAVITSITEMIGFGATWYLLKRRTKFVPDMSIVGKTLVATVLMSVFLYVFRDKFILALLSGGVIFVVVMAMFGVLNKEKMMSVFLRESS